MNWATAGALLDCRLWPQLPYGIGFWAFAIAFQSLHKRIAGAARTAFHRSGMRSAYLGSVFPSESSGRDEDQCFALVVRHCSKSLGNIGGDDGNRLFPAFGRELRRVGRPVLLRVARFPARMRMELFVKNAKEPGCQIRLVADVALPVPGPRKRFLRQGFREFLFETQHVRKRTLFRNETNELFPKRGCCALVHRRHERLHA